MYKLIIIVWLNSSLSTAISNKLAPYGTDGELFATDVSA